MIETPVLYPVCAVNNRLSVQGSVRQPVGISALGANLNNSKRRILWSVLEGILDRILWFLWKSYLFDTFFFAFFKFFWTSTQSEQASTQKLLFLKKRPWRLIDHFLRYGWLCSGITACNETNSITVKC